MHHFVVGADRIAANGDTANKIGTYSVAVLASAHQIPFYVAAPSTTFDLTIESGEQIPIEGLYYSKNGKRYRSLGDQDITSPIESNASSISEIIVELSNTRTSERAGRAMDHEREDAFERLRAQGYM